MELIWWRRACSICSESCAAPHEDGDADAERGTPAAIKDRGKDERRSFVPVLAATTVVRKL